MKKIKLSETEKYIIRNSHNELNMVLQKIKRNRLEGQALKDMKILEEAVINLECFSLGK